MVWSCRREAMPCSAPILLPLFSPPPTPAPFLAHGIYVIITLVSHHWFICLPAFSCFSSTSSSCMGLRNLSVVLT